MQSKSLKKLALSLLLSSFGLLPVQAENPDWTVFKYPVAGKPRPVGKYTNGCLIGGERLPLEGTGYQVIRREKERYYAHPDMISYLKRLGIRANHSKLPTILISDIAMPVGGRFKTGHQSHQLGLDVDIWFRMGKLSEEQAMSSTGLAPLMVINRKMTKSWGENQIKLLKLASDDPQVARIFVNPSIKVYLCQNVRGDRSWLRKIRPWNGHNAHFHVRLRCPKGAKECVDQADIPKGLGCDASLYSWLKPKPKSTKPKPSKPAEPPRPKVYPPPPELCQRLLDHYQIIN